MNMQRKHFTYQIPLLACMVMLSAIMAACSPSPPSPAPQAFPPTPIYFQDVNGTMTSVSGSSLTVTTAQGRVTVNVGSNTIIEKAIAGTPSDIIPDQFAMVTGNSDSSGNITASDILIRPQDQSDPFPALIGVTPHPTTVPPGPNNGTGPGASSNPIESVYSGTLTTVNGNTLTLTTLQTAPAQITVTIASDTTIEKTVSAKLSDLNAGDLLTVLGTPDSSGNISAGSITDRQ